jgi:hypothetical protein
VLLLLLLVDKVDNGFDNLDNNINSNNDLNNNNNTICVNSTNGPNQGDSNLNRISNLLRSTSTPSPNPEQSPQEITNSNNPLFEPFAGQNEQSPYLDGCVVQLLGSLGLVQNQQIHQNQQMLQNQHTLHSPVSSVDDQPFFSQLHQRNLERYHEQTRVLYNQKKIAKKQRQEHEEMQNQDMFGPRQRQHEEVIERRQQTIITANAHSSQKSLYNNNEKNQSCNTNNDENAESFPTVNNVVHNDQSDGSQNDSNNANNTNTIETPPNRSPGAIFVPNQALIKKHPILHFDNLTKDLQNLTLAQNQQKLTQKQRTDLDYDVDEIQDGDEVERIPNFLNFDQNEKNTPSAHFDRYGTDSDQSRDDGFSSSNSNDESQADEQNENCPKVRNQLAKTLQNELKQAQEDFSLECLRVSLLAHSKTPFSYLVNICQTQHSFIKFHFGHLMHVEHSEDYQQFVEMARLARQEHYVPNKFQLGPQTTLKTPTFYSNSSHLAQNGQLTAALTEFPCDYYPKNFTKEGNEMVCRDDEYNVLFEDFELHLDSYTPKFNQHDDDIDSKSTMTTRASKTSTTNPKVKKGKANKNQVESNYPFKSLRGNKFKSVANQQRFLELVDPGFKSKERCTSITSKQRDFHFLLVYPAIHPQLTHHDSHLLFPMSASQQARRGEQSAVNDYGVGDDNVKHEHAQVQPVYHQQNQQKEQKHDRKQHRKQQSEQNHQNGQNQQIQHKIQNQQQTHQTTQQPSIIKSNGTQQDIDATADNTKFNNKTQTTIHNQKDDINITRRDITTSVQINLNITNTPTTTALMTPGSNLTGESHGLALHHYSLKSNQKSILNQKSTISQTSQIEMSENNKSQPNPPSTITNYVTTNHLNQSDVNNTGKNWLWGIHTPLINPTTPTNTKSQNNNFNNINTPAENHTIISPQHYQHPHSASSMNGSLGMVETQQGEENNDNLNFFDQVSPQTFNFCESDPQTQPTYLSTLLFSCEELNQNTRGQYNGKNAQNGHFKANLNINDNMAQLYSSFPQDPNNPQKQLYSASVPLTHMQKPMNLPQTIPLQTITLQQHHSLKGQLFPSPNGFEYFAASGQSIVLNQNGSNFGKKNQHCAQNPISQHNSSSLSNPQGPKSSASVVSNTSINNPDNLLIIQNPHESSLFIPTSFINRNLQYESAIAGHIVHDSGFKGAHNLHNNNTCTDHNNNHNHLHHNNNADLNISSDLSNTNVVMSSSQPSETRSESVELFSLQHAQNPQVGLNQQFKQTFNQIYQSQPQLLPLQYTSSQQAQLGLQPNQIQLQQQAPQTSYQPQCYPTQIDNRPVQTRIDHHIQDVEQLQRAYQIPTSQLNTYLPNLHRNNNNNNTIPYYHQQQFQ